MIQIRSCVHQRELKFASGTVPRYPYESEKKIRTKDKERKNAWTRECERESGRGREREIN